MGTARWSVYRVKYLVQAIQLAEQCSVLVGGEEPEIGHPGDYLVRYSDGSRRIVPRRVFEGLYSEMEFHASLPEFKEDRASG